LGKQQESGRRKSALVLSVLSKVVGLVDSLQLLRRREFLHPEIDKVTGKKW